MNHEVVEATMATRQDETAHGGGLADPEFDWGVMMFYEDGEEYTESALQGKRKRYFINFINFYTAIFLFVFY